MTIPASFAMTAMASSRTIAGTPMATPATTFRVVIYSDPYYYPATRYRGTRVVYVQPRRGVAHFGFKERAAGEAATPQVVVRNTPPRDPTGCGVGW